MNGLTVSIVFARKLQELESRIAVVERVIRKPMAALAAQAERNRQTEAALTAEIRAVIAAHSGADRLTAKRIRKQLDRLTDNVTPIRPTSKPRRRRAPKQRVGVKLSESDEGRDFSTWDVVNGLHGVCVALDDAVVSALNKANAEYLAQAAKVLSTIARDRWM